MKTAIILTLLTGLCKGNHQAPPDVTIVGYAMWANGLGRVTTAWLDVLKNNNVSFINTRPEMHHYEDIPSPIKSLLKSQCLPSPYISILTDNLWLPSLAPYKLMPQSYIKIARSFCESTKIPAQWVAILNAHFDAVIVADPYFVHVYTQSGVNIPVLCIPEPLFLDEFLEAPLKTKPQKPFVFGMIASLSHNKNSETAIAAFAREFKKSEDVILKIHSPWNHYADVINQKLGILNFANIQLTTGKLNRAQYLEFMQSLDCYILLSRGEGFSITPREAMALGTPCILSNNTAHQTICNSGLVYAVAADIEKPSRREFYGVDVGNNFECTLEDVRNAMHDVFSNYSKHIARAHDRRSWANGYHRNQIAPLIHTLIHPENLILGNTNTVTPTTLTVNSKQLYNKYRAIKNFRKSISSRK